MSAVLNESIVPGARPDRRVKVFVTIDTEAWPRCPRWRETSLRDDVEREIYGTTSNGPFGIGYQMDVLEAYGLKAVFFVETLFACAVGIDPLRNIVQEIERRGHDVQLHVHPEWLKWMSPSLLPGRHAHNLKDLSQDEQEILLVAGLENLRRCGIHNPCAFRAGNYSANFDTLRALARLGIKYDTSYNACYLDSDCGLRTESRLLQPQLLSGIYEFPISFFSDWPGHFRHAQLCACSSRELQTVLLNAWHLGWYSFVLVTHSFELVKRRNRTGVPPVPDWVVIRRFERLCRFLAEHADKFQTCGFGDVDAAEIDHLAPTRALKSRVYQTAERFLQQLARRVI